MHPISTTNLALALPAQVVVVPRTLWHSYKSMAQNGAQEEFI